MGIHTIKLPDVGEGVAEAEFVALHVKPGDMVKADQNLADVMTDKATVEIPSPRTGKVIWIGPAVGEVVAVGSEIIRIEVDGAGNTAASADAPSPAAPAPKTPAPAVPAPAAAPTPPAPPPVMPPANGAVPTPAATMSAAPRARDADAKPLASPAVRARARARGIDLQMVIGTGPAGRISHEDVDAYADGKSPARAFGPAGGRAPNLATEEVKIIGLRRKIAEKMQEAKRRIPHITYVEEVDVTALEDLRAHMNARKSGDQPKLTILPYLMQAIILSVRRYPHLNARFDDDAGVVTRFGAAHIGIATQTPGGLMVPVVRHAEANDLWQNAREITRLSAAARDGTARRDELSGSTITITSLGAIGGIVTTPVINYPEVSIVGVNKIQTLPRYDVNRHLQPRKIMNLSSGFDHRIVDGWDAAEFVQALKGYLEFPATLFV